MNTLLGSILLNALVAAVLAVSVWGTGMIPLVRRRPKLRHFLWIIVLLKLVTPPMFEISVLPAWFVADPLPKTHPRAVPLDEVVDLSLAPAAAIHIDAPLVLSQRPTFDWGAVLAAVSGLGTVTIMALAVRQMARLRRALRRGESSDKRLSEIARRCAEQMGIATWPTVCVVSANVPPLLWVRARAPLVVIPRRLADEMSDEQLRCVICHEIAHSVRRDHWTNALSLLVAAVCWWHPVVWWARRELRTAQEACCDALVISRSVASRRVYAETLLHALEFIQTERSTLPALASGFGGKTSTRRRFEMIANVRVNHRLSWWSYPVLLAALAVLPLLPTFSRAQETKEPTPGAAPLTVDYDLDGRIDVYFPSALPDARQTERRTYQVQRSERGWVVLAFDRRTKKLAWSSEIELARRDPKIAVPDGGTTTLGGAAAVTQRFLLHTGDGVVTIAVVAGDENLKLQELDATTGQVIAECQLVGKPDGHISEDELSSYFLFVREQLAAQEDGSDEERARCQQTLKDLTRRLKLDLLGVVDPADADDGATVEQRLIEAQRLLELARQRARESGYVYRESCKQCHQEAYGEETQSADAAAIGQHDYLFWLGRPHPLPQHVAGWRLAIAQPRGPDAEEKSTDVRVRILPVPPDGQTYDLGLILRSQGGELEGPAARVVLSDWLVSSTGVGNEMIIDIVSPDGGNLTIERAAAIWRLVNGDAAIEQINMTRKDGKVRMVIKGAAKDGSGSPRGGENGAGVSGPGGESGAADGGLGG